MSHFHWYQPTLVAGIERCPKRNCPKPERVIPKEGAKVEDDDLVARAAREAAIGHAEAGMDPRFAMYAYQAVRRVCARLVTFTAADVWKEIEEEMRPREPRAIGVVLRRAQAAGLCEPTNVWKETSRIESHGRPERVWRSLIVRDLGR